MKKSQVLAALALAFALGLGVIAPTANTYATIIGTEPEVTDAGKAITDVINKGYNVGGAVEVNGTQTLVYTLYADTISAVTAAEKTVKQAEDTAATDLKAVLTGAGLHTAVSTSTLRNATYQQVVDYIRNYINTDLTAAVQKGAAAGATSDEQTAGNNAKDDISTLNGNLAAQKAAVEAVYATQAQAILNEAADLADVAAVTTKDGKYDLAAYNKVVAAAKALPKYNQYKTLVEAIGAAYAMTQAGTTATVSEANKAVEAVESAIAAVKGTTDGTGEGENKPGDDEKDPSAPDTGILANTEGSASTTLAMVAGIATALTAAGAGVVAYRNARRSSRK